MITRPLPLWDRNMGRAMSMERHQFTGADYNRMAKELEDLAAIDHPEMNHLVAERLKIIAKEMRIDARSAVLNTKFPHP